MLVSVSTREPRSGYCVQRHTWWMLLTCEQSFVKDSLVSFAECSSQST